jgi:hypothetical protein
MLLNGGYNLSFDIQLCKFPAANEPFCPAGMT